jgi:DNA-binding transcriptional ArsR family regulator
LSEHMRVLSDAELVQSKRMKQWTFYKRNEAQIKKIKRQFSAEL